MKIRTLILFILLPAMPVFSQDIRLKGKVVDNNGRELEGVKIVLQDVRKERVVVTISSDAGLFALNGLKAGKYDISFASPGFEDKVEKDFEIIADYENSILVRMQEKRKQKRKSKHDNKL